eukprot:m.267236 g.267236  ORF g.267236 m.267236 type:complete len:149 (+) comp32647_c0_seq1:200-646(+)
MTDISDLFFRQNPFKFMYNHPSTDLFLGKDKGLLAAKDRVWMRNKLKLCYGQFHDAGKEVVNAGCVGGKIRAILQLLRLMKREFEDQYHEKGKALTKENPLLPNCNMAIYNHVVHGLLAPNYDIFWGAPFTSPFKKFNHSESFFIIHK